MYDESGDGHEQCVEANFPKNRLHLVWPGVLPIAYRTGPISPHDNAPLAVAKTTLNTNAFEFLTKEFSAMYAD